jgi:hypothetical protein
VTLTYKRTEPGYYVVYSKNAKIGDGVERIVAEIMRVTRKSDPFRGNRDINWLIVKEPRPVGFGLGGAYRGPSRGFRTLKEAKTALRNRIVGM